MNQLFPGQKYIAEITDSPLLASSRMVFMVHDLAKGLRNTSDPYKALVTAKTHRDIDLSAPPLAVDYVYTAPTRSNSRLQTLVAQYVSVSGRPEQLTVAYVQRDRSHASASPKQDYSQGAFSTKLTKFTPEYGVQAQVNYDSLRPPQPEVVAAMLKSWQELVKKPSIVVVVVSSGSMKYNKLLAVQQTLQNYINSLAAKDRIARN